MRSILAVWLAAMLEVRAKPRAFVLDLTFMIINNLAWVVVWVFIFRNTGPIRGWDLQHYYLFFSVVAMVYGISFGLFTNARRISQMIIDSELDAALTLPVDTLAYLLVRRVDAANIGDMVFGIGVFVIACDPTPVSFLVFLLTSVLGAVVLTSFLVCIGSLTFHVGGGGEQQRIGFEAITLFSFYPVDLFGGFTKVLMYSVLPGAFISGIPTSLVSGFGLMQFAALLVAAAVAAGLARFTFTTGLRKYRSGSRWTLA